MSRTHACALSWHLQLSLASPAESGMTIILERLCIIQLKPYAREINHICNNSQVEKIYLMVYNMYLSIR